MHVNKYNLSYDEGQMINSMNIYIIEETEFRHNIVQKLFNGPATNMTKKIFKKIAAKNE